MAGLLDWISTPAGVGLLSAVAGGMAGARKGQPWNTAGRAGLAGLTGYSQANDQIRTDKENAFQNQYRQTQMDELKQKMETQKAQQAWKSGLPAALNATKEQRTPFEADNAFGEDLGNLQNAAQVPDMQARQDYMMRPESPYAEKMIEQQLFPKQAKYGEVKFSGDGRAYMQGDDGSIKWVNDVTPRDKLVADNLGGKQVYRTEYSADPVAEVERTATPDSVMSNDRAISEGRLNRGVTIRGQDIGASNAAAARAVTMRGQDKPPQAARGGPMSVTLQKELLESDDVAQASQNVINTLDSALKLNNKAYSGYGAKPRAILRSNLPGQSEAADATIGIDNMMTGQALESLKLIFGGMPTEGERKILMEMQASADKTPGQRADIMNRAKAAAKRRGEYAAGKARSIRGGTYLTEGVGQPAAPSGGVKFLGFE